MWSLPLRAKRTHFPSPSNQLALGFKISQKSLDSIGVKKSEKIFDKRTVFAPHSCQPSFLSFFLRRKILNRYYLHNQELRNSFPYTKRLKIDEKYLGVEIWFRKRIITIFDLFEKNILNKLWLYSVMANWMKFVLLIFWIVSLRVIWQMSKLQFMIEKLTSGLLTPSSMSQSCPIFPRRPKCANLARAGTKPYETVGNRQVKINFAF